MEPLRNDPELGPLVEAHGELPIGTADDEFARLVVAIVNQQLSVESASAIRERLFDRVEVTPAGVRDAEESTLRDVGLSGQKIEYVRNVAAAFEDRDLSRNGLADESDEAVIDALTEIRGVGVWTAKMYLIYVLGRPDVFPVEDLGVRRAMAELYGYDDGERAEMTEHAERWRPYRSYASRYLWRVVD
ncbi:DNA-3-methyladenine glycosylase family protein [Halobellus limi]|uniref:DNA-3-methyladenine glycosylase 2 family protein n=1 Tax=Halobellus limi TaxID=699433 RepID=A0A1H5UNY5_9EURY|nr:DNA-3-methyladenine glycosylase [Halobellus limi]QCC46975.1 DNA-3-methyladenine glycosylase 2 family protein [Halobellus limi]SEF76759.1 DNA-3-methyladenine glycosylase II [Halobellus limi]